MAEYEAYVAGFFDGEGSISIVRQRAGHYSDYHKIMVAIGQRARYRRILDEIAEKFGGSVTLRKQTLKESERWATQAIWSLQKWADIERFLEAIQPYAVVKAEQIAIALEFVRTRTLAIRQRNELGQVQGMRLMPGELDRREGFRVAMLTANNRGPGHFSLGERL
jgi:LAGLIDADG DNA endonuclease family protein